MRVRNLNGSGFEYQLEEWDCDDGIHHNETIGVISIGNETGRPPRANITRNETRFA